RQRVPSTFDPDARGRKRRWRRRAIRRRDPARRDRIRTHRSRRVNRFPDRLSSITNRFERSFFLSDALIGFDEYFGNRAEEAPAVGKRGRTQKKRGDVAFATIERNGGLDEHRKRTDLARPLRREEVCESHRRLLGPLTV